MPAYRCLCPLHVHLAGGVSRSTWYRCQTKQRKAAAAAAGAAGAAAAGAAAAAVVCDVWVVPAAGLMGSSSHLRPPHGAGTYESKAVRGSAARGYARRLRDVEIARRGPVQRQAAGQSTDIVRCGPRGRERCVQRGSVAEVSQALFEALRELGLRGCEQAGVRNVPHGEAHAYLDATS